MSARPGAGGSSVDIAEITRDELVRAMTDRRITLVDVLSPETFAGVHIPGAISLPVADLARRAAALLPDRTASIVTYCGGPT